MPSKADFTKVFAELKSIFKPYVKKMDLASDTGAYYLLNTRYTMKNKQPLPRPLREADPTKWIAEA